MLDKFKRYIIFVLLLEASSYKQTLKDISYSYIAIGKALVEMRPLSGLFLLSIPERIATVSPTKLYATRIGSGKCPLLGRINSIFIFLRSFFFFSFFFFFLFIFFLLFSLFSFGNNNCTIRL